MLLECLYQEAGDTALKIHITDLQRALCQTTIELNVSTEYRISFHSIHCHILGSGWTADCRVPGF